MSVVLRGAFGAELRPWFTLHYSCVLRGPDSALAPQIPGPPTNAILTPVRFSGFSAGLGFFAISALFSAHRALFLRVRAGPGRGPAGGSHADEARGRVPAVGGCQGLRLVGRPLWFQSFRGRAPGGCRGHAGRRGGAGTAPGPAAGEGGRRRRFAAVARPGRGRPRKVLGPDRAVSVLLDYGRAARAVQPQMSEGDLDAALRLHAQVLGVAPDDIDDVVADALARVFGKPQVEPVADPSQPPE